MNTSTAAPLLHSPADAAKLLGISRAKLYELLDEGSVPSVKIGRSRRISHRALLGFVQGLEEVR